jgi:uncharacterized protein (DUF427 family)
MSNHIATTRQSSHTYQVFYGGQLVLETDQVVEVLESHAGRDFPVVAYFSPASVEGLALEKTSRVTTCPVKGQASYWRYADTDSGIWSYGNPIEGMAAIRGYLAFDQSQGFRVTPR